MAKYLLDIHIFLWWISDAGKLENEEKIIIEVLPD